MSKASSFARDRGGLYDVGGLYDDSSNVEGAIAKVANVSSKVAGAVADAAGVCDSRGRRKCLLASGRCRRRCRRRLRFSEMSQMSPVKWQELSQMPPVPAILGDVANVSCEVAGAVADAAGTYDSRKCLQCCGRYHCHL